MARIVKNRSISFGTVDRLSIDINNFNEVLTITDGELLTMPKLLSFSHDLIFILITSYWGFLIIGSYFRYIFYKCIYQDYRAGSRRTVDRFTLAIALIHHLSIFLSSIEVTIKVLNIELISESIIGYGTCRFNGYYGKFATAYAGFGSLGLASFRLLCIKKGHFVKDVIGEKLLANTILCVGLGAPLLMLLLPRILEQNWSYLEWEPCLKIPQIHHVLEILDDYELSMGRSSILKDWKFSHSISLVIILLVTIIEICLYISFFHHMYKHDNCTRLARIIEPAIIHKRNKQNAISFFGQFCSFVMEFIGDVLFITAISKMKHKDKNPVYWYRYAFICRPATFAAISFVEVVTSNVLRPKILKF